MKRFLAGIAMLATLLFPSAASAYSWGTHQTRPNVDIGGLTSWTETQIYMTPTGNWSVGTNHTNYEFGMLLVANRTHPLNFLQIGISKDGTGISADDCGNNGSVRSIFVEWKIGSAYHCQWGQPVSNSETHTYKIARCTTNTTVWCAYVDGTQLGSSHDLGWSVSDYTYSGGEQYTSGTDGSQPLYHLDWMVGVGSNWQLVKGSASSGGPDVCTYNAQGVYNVDGISASYDWYTDIGPPFSGSNC